MEKNENEFTVQQLIAELAADQSWEADDQLRAMISQSLRFYLR